MIRFLSLICFALTLNIGFSQDTSKEKKIVVSSASMIWDMVNNIAGDKVESKLIVPIGGDPHIYEPSPGDARKVESADLIFVNGLTFEGWITELIDNSGTKGKTITVTEGIDAISSSVYKNAYDPHAWMDVSLGQKYIQNILNGLIELDPNNAATYQANYDAYSKRLADLDAYIERRIKEIPEDKRLLVTSHDAFAYYGRRYGVKVEGVIGISTESEAQTSDMVRVVKAIKSSGVPAIFVETTINPKLLKQIAKDNNVQIGGALFADSIGEKGSRGNSYYDMLKSNTDVIVNALTSKGSTTSMHDQDSSGSSFIPYLILGIILIIGLLLFIWKMNS